MTSRSIKTLEMLLVESVNGPTNMSAAFKKVSKIFNSLGIEYALIGAIATGATTPLQMFTKDIDILVYDESRKKIHTELTKNGFRTTQDGLDKSEYMVRYTENETGIEVDVMYTDEFSDPEASVVGLAVSKVVFGTKINVSNPEMSAWMYLTSDQIKHEARVVELIKVNGFDISVLKKYLTQAGDNDLIKKFNTLAERANAETKKRTK